MAIVNRGDGEIINFNQVITSHDSKLYKIYNAKKGDKLILSRTGVNDKCYAIYFSFGICDSFNHYNPSSFPITDCYKYSELFPDEVSLFGQRINKTCTIVNEYLFFQDFLLIEANPLSSETGADCYYTIEVSKTGN